MTTVQIKTYLFPDNLTANVESIAKISEIRRFNLINEAGVYDCLVDKIRESYGELAPSRNEIRCYYIDDEKEMIGFSTDSEMKFAIELTNQIKQNSLFKVYVARVNSNNESGFSQYRKEEEGPQLHRGVLCDGCNGCIVGVRHKCSTCPDYDLCSACELKGTHKETGHTFIKITKPRRCPYSGYRRGRCTRFRVKEDEPVNEHDQATSQKEPAKPNPIQQKLNEFLPFIASSIPIVNNTDQLKNVGEYIKSFLDPFGIDVDYHIDNINNSKPTDEKKEETVEKILIPTTEKDESSSKSEPELNSVPLTKLVPSESLKSEADFVNMSITQDLNLNQEKPSETSQTVLEKEAIEKNKEESPRAEVEEAGFNFADIEKELKIVKAIEQLKAMGYTDDGGWLTRLTSAKDGNINAVLDAIMPSK